MKNKRGSRFLLWSLAKKVVSDPFLFIKLLKKENFQKGLHYLRTDARDVFESRLEDYLRRNRRTENREIRIARPENQPLGKLKFPACSENPLVSIIIPVHNQFEHTFACLRSVLDGIGGTDCEIIVADDASSDETRRIENHVENIKVIRNEENIGFLKTCNRASEFARGRYLLFLNNDTRVAEGWLEALLETAENDQGVGLVGSKLVSADGRLQEAGGIVWKDATAWNFGRYDDPDKPQYNYVKETDYVSGASLLIRSDLWKEIGGFDERFAPAYYEDTDLAFEARKRGYKTIYQPKSVVVHFEGASHGTRTKEGVKSYQEKNRAKFLDKWKDVLDQEHFLPGENVFWARDRSFGKKTVLVVDRYVPHFDREAGGRSVYQYMSLFLKMGMNVKFVGDDPFPYEPYTATLQQSGVEVLYEKKRRSLAEEWLKKNGRFVDVVFLNRPGVAIKYIDLVKKYTSSKIIYYGHDLHYLREYREYMLKNNKELKKSSDRWRRIELDILNKVDVAYFPSAFEVETVRKECPDANVKVIPVFYYERFDDSEAVPFSERSGMLFVGGFGHRPNIDGILWFVQEVWPFVLRAIPDLKFYIVGANPPSSILTLQSEHITVTGFVDDERLRAYYSSCRLAVVPLRFGAGIKGKVVEAMYHGLPVVTTPVGSEGLPDLADCPAVTVDGDELADALIRLYRDDKRLQELSIRSREYVRKHFSAEAAIRAVEEDF